MLSADTHSGVYLQFWKQRNGFTREIRACSASINGHPVENYSTKFTVSSRVAVNNHSDSVWLLDSMLGRLKNEKVTWFTIYNSNSKPVSSCWTGMMEGVVTNQVTLAYTNWPQPWSQSLTLTNLHKARCLSSMDGCRINGPFRSVRDDEKRQNNSVTNSWQPLHPPSNTEHSSQLVLALWGGHGLYGLLWLVSHLQYSCMASIYSGMVQ